MFPAPLLFDPDTLGVVDQQPIFETVTPTRRATMGQTYRAMLRGDRVDWIDPPPSREGDTEVQITLLRPDPEPDEVRRARRRSAVW